ncbi:MAG: S8 family serine peptidase [Candidatus Woesearchaeota archaeon]
MEIKKEVIAMLILTIILLFLTNTTYADISNNLEISKNYYVPGEVIVKYKDNVIGNGNEILVYDELLIYDYIEKPVGSEEIGKGVQTFNYKFDEDVDVLEIINEYESMPEVEYAEPNYLFEIHLVPNDPSYSSQYSMPNINVEEVWNFTVGNKNTTIAIIDTGVDWDHPDISYNIWNNTDEDCDFNTDLDSNGYFGDCRGYDFVNVTSGCSPSDDCDVEDNNPMDFNGHGTHCSGIASAVSNNNLGVAGACWNCTIMPVRAGFQSLTGQGSLAVDDVTEALYYASENNATVISMSFGGATLSSTFQAAINASYENGSILVASAGNDAANSRQYPCAYDNVICVAATDSDNTSASYSNYGTWVAVSAPGTSVYNTYYNDTYVTQSGTSMSTPLVAGAIGLIKTVLNKNQTEINDALNNTGLATDFNGVNINRIDIYAAILYLDDIKPNVTLISPSNNHINLTLNQTFSCNATDWQLNNITLQIWNSSDALYYNESRNISGTSNKSEFNVTLAVDSYTWNCLYHDNQSNRGYAVSNFTVLIKNISATLDSPVNDTFTNNNQTKFNCSAQTESTKELTNLTLQLWNSSNSLYHNETKNISGSSNSSIFSHNLSLEGSYHWNCKAFNNDSISSSAIYNFTITYDKTYPDISLLDPIDSSSYSANSQKIVFGFNVSDQNEITNCSLMINGIVNQTNLTINKTITQNFTVTLGTGSYNWNVNCTDNSNNIGNSTLRSFTITAPEAGTSSTGGGGGGGTVISKTYIISTEQGSSGYTKSLAADDKIQFTFFDERSQRHSITVKDVKTDYVDIIIQSNPINLRLGIGQSARLNLTGPDYYNLYIKLNSIEDEKAEITIQTINEPIPKQPSMAGEAVKEQEPKDKIEVHKESDEIIQEKMRLLDFRINKLKIYIYIAILIIIMALIIILIKEKINLNSVRNQHIDEYKDKFNKYIKPKDIKSRTKYKIRQK